MIALLFSIFTVYEHFFGFCPMSCTVVLLVISATSRIRYGNSQCFKQKLSFLKITNVIKLVNGKKLQIYIRIKLTTESQ